MNYRLKDVKTIIKATIGDKLNFGFLFNMVLKWYQPRRFGGTVQLAMFDYQRVEPPKNYLENGD